MGASVGKSTLVSLEPNSFTEVSRIDVGTRREARNRPRKGEAVASSNHRRNPFFPLEAIRVLGGERTQPASSRKTQGSVDCFQIGAIQRCAAVVLADAGVVQCFDQPALAIAASAQPP